MSEMTQGAASQWIDACVEEPPKDGTLIMAEFAGEGLPNSVHIGRWCPRSSRWVSDGFGYFCAYQGSTPTRWARLNP